MFFLVTMTILVACAQGKFYTDCGSKLATVESVGVSDCADDATECVLKRNSNVSITIDLIPSKDIKTITTEVHGVIMNLPVPFPLPQPDACQGNGLQCPLKANQKVSYKTSLPVLKSYPKVKVEVKWELKNEDEENIVCILIPARLK